MARSFVAFRSERNIRTIPDIRRRPLYPKTLLSEYDNSPRLKALLCGFEKAVDPYWAIDAFYQAIFDPRTAIGWGLDVWGRIVGIARDIVMDGDQNVFGFFGSDLQPFGQAPFYFANATNTYTLTDTAFRVLVFLKAAINISTGTLAELNYLFSKIFGERGHVMVLHTGTMHLRLVFRFKLSLYERGLLGTGGANPVPAGVGYDIYDVPVKTFGFQGSNLMPFDQGAYVQGGPINADSI